MASLYFYKRHDTEYGPVNAAALKELARSGGLQASDLLRKEGTVEWRPAGEAKGLFSTSPPEPVISSNNSDRPETAEGSDPATTTQNISSSVAASFLVGAGAAVLLHAVQWLCGWGWGSLWGIASSVVILSLGTIPWMLDHEGIKSPAAAYGAGLGAALGVIYGWFAGSVLSGVVFCASIGTWGAWLAERKGVKTKVAQAGIVAACLTGFYLLGMTAPSSGSGSQWSPANRVSGSTTAVQSQERQSRGAVAETASAYKKGWDYGKGTAEISVEQIKRWAQRSELSPEQIALATDPLRASLLETAMRLKERAEFYAGPQIISRPDGSNGPPTAEQKKQWKDNGDYAKGAYEGLMSLARPYLP